MKKNLLLFKMSIEERKNYFILVIFYKILSFIILVIYIFSKQFLRKNLKAFNYCMFNFKNLSSNSFNNNLFIIFVIIITYY